MAPGGCGELDEEVERFRARPLAGPYMWLDATYVKARQDGRVASTAVVIAVGVNGETGQREVSGFDVGPSEEFRHIDYHIHDAELTDLRTT